jgi:hypothetical protein
MVCIYKIKVLYLHQKINLSIHFKNFRLMKNNELLKKYAGISTRIRRIFAYHYDQIQREVQTEILHQLEISNLLEQLKNN